MAKATLPYPARGQGQPKGSTSIMTSKNVRSSFLPVQPVQPLAGYIGGKRNLATRLCALIATIPHSAYAEPFVGMGGIFLRRTARPKAEFINDWSTDVSTFFRILQRHYVAFLERYDRPGTLFYLDPPYFGSEGDYGAEMFSREQFDEMAEVLAGLKGQFLLSINDHKTVRQVFKAFPMVAVKTSYSIMGGATERTVGELVIGSSKAILAGLSGDG
jgi:site-specific DNA-adenine methylase